MQKIGKLIDKIPLQMLVLLTIVMAVAPYPMQDAAPHLYAKLVMLANGALVQGLDIFDLLWHSLPAAILAIRLVRKFGKQREG